MCFPIYCFGNKSAIPRLAIKIGIVYSLIHQEIAFKREIKLRFRAVSLIKKHQIVAVFLLLAFEFIHPTAFHDEACIELVPCAKNKSLYFEIELISLKRNSVQVTAMCRVYNSSLLAIIMAKISFNNHKTHFT